MKIEYETIDMFDSLMPGEAIMVPDSLIKKEVIIEHFPFPPSTNELYQNAKGKGRVKTSKYRQYCRDVEAFRLKNLRIISEMRELIKTFGLLSVEYQFNIKDKQLFCVSKNLEGKPKRYDVTNRVKACEDQVFKILKMDDSFVFKNSEEKIPVNNNQENYVNIIIRQYQ